MCKKLVLSLSVFFVSILHFQAVAAPGDLVSIPIGSDLAPVREPRGNGKGECGSDLLWNAVERHSGVSATFGVNAFKLGKSAVKGGEPTLMGMEFSSLYGKDAVLAAIKDLNEAFGAGTARLLVANDTIAGKLEPDTTGFVVSARFRDSSDPSVCTDQLPACFWESDPLIYQNSSRTASFCLGQTKCIGFGGGSAEAVCKPVGANLQSCPTAKECIDDPTTFNLIRPKSDESKKQVPEKHTGAAQ
jgi:hypothetical protein